MDLAGLPGKFKIPGRFTWQVQNTWLVYLQSSENLAGISVNLAGIL
jgi:hypothetical protein